MAICLLGQEILKACFLRRPGWGDPATRRQLTSCLTSYFPEFQTFMPRKPTSQDIVAASNFKNGDSKSESMRKAGYSESYIRSFAGKYFNSPRFLQAFAALQKAGESLTNEQLGK